MKVRIDEANCQVGYELAQLGCSARTPDGDVPLFPDRIIPEGSINVYVAQELCDDGMVIASVFVEVDGQLSNPMDLPEGADPDDYRHFVLMGLHDRRSRQQCIAAHPAAALKPAWQMAG